MIKLLVYAAIIFFTCRLLPGIYINSYFTAIIAAFVLALLNSFVKPILFFITLPVTVLTLGLFMFVLNAFMLYMTACFISGFQITSFCSTILASIIISLVYNIIFN